MGTKLACGPGMPGPYNSEIKNMLNEKLKSNIEKLRADNLYRTLRVMESAPGARVMFEGKKYVNFASNNYLGLACDERLKGAAKKAVDEWGTGATASRLLGGTFGLHSKIEKVLGDFKRFEACAVFPSGYQANLGAMSALMGPEDTVILDRYCHASLVDGARLSKSKLRVFKHNNPTDLEKILKRHPKSWVVTESLFSMDGDVAPLKEYVEIAKQYQARLYVDEAHATGVFGPKGSGLINEWGLESKIDVCMGTLSKALGGQGGYIGGSRELIEWIHNSSRSFIYSTGLNPGSLASALAAVVVCMTEPTRRERLLFLSERLRMGLGLQSKIKNQKSKIFNSPIIPFVVGSEEKALHLAKVLWEAGIYAPAIRPPTVPKGTSRIRFSVTSDHTEQDIDRVIEILNKWR